MSRAVFLDRDGVINEGGVLVTRPEQLRIVRGAPEAIRLLKEAGFKVIVVTNQPVIARGLCTEDEVKEILQKMVNDLGEAGKLIDGIYYCPHHPETGHEDIPEWAKKYRVDCTCRKPKPGMLLKAAQEHEIDIHSSFFIGDSTRDIMAGKSAGCKTLLVKTGYAGKDGLYDAKPDAAAEDILDAAKLVVKTAEAPAVILVGGRGERLRPLTDAVPKPLLPVAGKPILEWQLDLLRRHGVKKVVMCGHYLLNKIADYFGRSFRGLQIEYVDDGEHPLGSGGALKNLDGKLGNDFVLLSGDVMTNLDISALALSHFSSKALATMVVRETDHPHDSDIVQMDEHGRAVRFFPKKESGKVGNLGNTGLFMLSPEIAGMVKEVPCGLENDILAGLISGGSVRCYLSKDYIKDMGTPERYEKVQEDFSKLTGSFAASNSTAVVKA
jgi:D,D-heptose 1,7-bisphosphate phosphatase